MALPVNLPAQLGGGRPAQARPHQTPFHAKDNATQKARPLPWRNMSADPTGGFIPSLQEDPQCELAFARVHVEGPARDRCDHRLSRDVVIQDGGNLILSYLAQQGHEGAQHFANPTKALTRDLNHGVGQARFA